MNRAWIPAGALASVSVAGLIALGPLTDSLGTSVSFPQSVQVNTGTSTVRASVPVSVNVKVVGNVKTAPAVSRGGAAADTGVTSESGQVAYKKQAAVTPRVSSTPAKPAVKLEKKTPKRQQTIAATGETNGDNGLASKGQGPQGDGETSSTLAP
jgi:hypothetical protein